MKDFYKILRVEPSATEEEIKAAYRKLAHQHHPDKGGNEDKFKEINEAYQILSDKYQRGAYDATIFIMRQSVAYSPVAQKSMEREIVVL
jgi:curved DNA-binding protein CbpA